MQPCQLEQDKWRGGASATACGQYATMGWLRLDGRALLTNSQVFFAPFPQLLHLFRFSVVRWRRVVLTDAEAENVGSWDRGTSRPSEGGAGGVGG